MQQIFSYKLSDPEIKLTETNRKDISSLIHSPSVHNKATDVKRKHHQNKEEEIHTNNSLDFSRKNSKLILTLLVEEL